MMAEEITKFIDPIVCIENWRALANEAPIDGIISLLEKSGNQFTLNLKSLSLPSNKLHVYITLNGSGTIDFLAISSGSDKESNKHIFDSALFPIPLGTEIVHINGTYTSKNALELISWVNNWLDTTKRNSWILNASKNGNMVQVFTIDTTDFMTDTLHDCYLALRPNSNPAIPNKYMIDLVVKNVETGQLLNLAESTNAETVEAHFRDMARPVPPFGQDNHPSTDPANFGILKSLGINE